MTDESTESKKKIFSTNWKLYLTTKLTILQEKKLQLNENNSE